jgi:hypothetical protein
MKRLLKLLRVLFRPRRKPIRPVEVQMKLDHESRERKKRMAQYAETWDRIWAERDAVAAKERRDRFTVVGQ